MARSRTLSLFTDLTDATSMAPKASNAASNSNNKATPPQNSNPERDKALTQVLTQIERTFGKGSIMRLGDAARMKVETIPTGALTLDIALGGGCPRDGW